MIKKKIVVIIWIILCYQLKNAIKEKKLTFNIR